MYCSRSKFLASFLPLLFLASLSLGQTKDVHAWMGFGLDVKLSKRTKIAYDQQLRLQQSFTQYRVYIHEWSLKYQLKKKLAVEVSHRWAINSRYEPNSFRPSIGITRKNSYRLNPESKKKKAKTLDLAFRTKYQHNYISNRQKKSNIWRNKVSLAYKRKKKKAHPTIAVEVFHPVFERESKLSQYRIAGGVAIETSGAGELGLKYIFEKEVNKEVADIIHIWAVVYSISL